MGTARGAQTAPLLPAQFISINFQECVNSSSLGSRRTMDHGQSCLSRMASKSRAVYAHAGVKYSIGRSGPLSMILNSCYQANTLENLPQSLSVSRVPKVPAPWSTAQLQRLTSDKTAEKKEITGYTDCAIYVTLTTRRVCQGTPACNHGDGRRRITRTRCGNARSSWTTGVVGLFGNIARWFAGSCLVVCGAVHIVVGVASVVVYVHVCVR